MKEITFEKLKELLLYRKIVKWEKSKIVLDNGVEISVEETEYDCCASAVGEFENVELDAAITEISLIEYETWEDGDTYGCRACVKFLHNRNLICSAMADADAGSGGYYYSIASFVVTFPMDENRLQCHFVSSYSGR